MNDDLTAEERQVYPTYVRRVFIWLVLLMMFGTITGGDGWLITASLLLVFDGLAWWLNRRTARV